jgi:hypothetical protein
MGSPTLIKVSRDELTFIKICFTHVGPSDPVDGNDYQRVFSAPMLFDNNKDELDTELSSRS